MRDMHDGLGAQLVGSLDGLKNMRFRTDAIGATLSIAAATAKPGGATRTLLAVKLPLQHKSG